MNIPIKNIMLERVLECVVSIMYIVVFEIYRCKSYVSEWNYSIGYGIYHLSFIMEEA